MPLKKKNINSVEQNRWTIDLGVNETSLTFKIDTGAEVYVLPVRLYKDISPKLKLHKTSVKLNTYNYTNIT